MKRSTWCYVLFAVLVLCASTVEAQQTVVINGVVYVAVAPNHGIPAAHGPIPNGSVRHFNNGYVGVNSRHFSRIPMKWGTGPVRATGPIVAHSWRGRGGCRPGSPVHHGGRGFVHGAVGPGGGFVAGGFQGNGWAVRGGVSFR